MRGCARACSWPRRPSCRSRATSRSRCASAFAEGGDRGREDVLFRAHGLLAVTRLRQARRAKRCRVGCSGVPGIGNGHTRGARRPRLHRAARASPAGGQGRAVPGRQAPAGGAASGGGALGGRREPLLRGALRRPRRRRRGARSERSSLPAHGEDKPVVAAVMAIDASSAEPVQLFVGAKEHGELAKLGHGLERVVQVGDWIGPIVLALHGALRWVQSHVGNWGWSIVLLTIADQPGDGALPALQHRERSQDGQDLARDAGDPGALPQGADDGPAAPADAGRRSEPSTPSTA